MTTAHHTLGKSQWRLRQLFTAIVLLFGTAACDQPDQEVYRPAFSDGPSELRRDYVIGVHPLHNPERLYEVFGPLAEHLSSEIPDANFKIEASRSYAAYDKKLYAGKFAFALPNPFQTVNSLKHGYRVFGKMGDDHNFRGIILVRKDSGIKQVSDLKGKAVSFPAPTALAATMMPQYYLQTHGVDVMDDLDVRYVGSQESSIMSVYLGNVAAGATWPPPWTLLSTERPELDDEMYPIWQTDPLPNNALVARDDVPDALVDSVAGAIFSLHEHAAGQKILSAMKLSMFEAAKNSTYLPVIHFLEKFSRDVRPVE